MAEAYNGGRFERTATGQLRWVPFSTEDARQANLRANPNSVLNNLMNPVPVPLVTPALDGLGNVVGATAAGVVNGMPNLGRMLFGGSERPATPPPPAAPSSGPALSFAPQAASMTPTSFRATGGSAPAAAAAPAPMTASDFLARALPGVRITGGDRTPERNAEVGGAARSHHLQPGRAVDFAPPPGVTIGQVRQAYEAAGWTVHEAIDETKKTRGTGPHFHIAASPPSGGAAQTPGGPGYVPLSAAQMLAMIPQPKLMNRVALPAAPQMEELPDRPQQQAIDKNIFLAPLAQALEVPERDRSRDAWERVQTMLGSAAAAMVGQTDTSDLILAGGAGAQKGFASERDRQRALDKADNELRREAKTMLAKAGMDVDLANLATINTNLDRAWQDKVAKAETKFANLSAVDQRAVQEIMQNLDIDRFNLGAQNQTALARAQAGMGVLESNNTLQNRSIEAGWQATQQRQQLVDQTNARLTLSGGIGNTAGLLGSVGIPVEPVRGETPDVTNARATAGYVAAGNTSMAVNGLATEMVLTGSYAELLSEDQVKAVQKMIQQENLAGAAMIIGQTLNGALAGPEGPKVVQAIDELAKRGGHPSAQIISTARNREAQQ